MTFNRRGQSRIVVPLLGMVLVIAMGFVLTGCGEEQPVGLADRALELAGKPSSGTPTVSSTDPTGAPVDTTLVVRVLGSGYDAGSTADFALDGQTIPQVRTNSTTFVSSKELRANITIDADAPTDLYDVIVITSKGKRGIGIEKFQVFIRATELGTLGSNKAWGIAINDNGEVVGESPPRGSTSHVFFWSAEGGMEEVGDDPEGASDLSDNRIIVGHYSDGQSQLAVAWTRLAPGNWFREVLPTPGFQIGTAYGIAPAGDLVVGFVKNPNQPSRPVVWSFSGAARAMEILPELQGGGGSAVEVSQNDLIAGYSAGLPVVWSRETGAWVLHVLAMPVSTPDGVTVSDINSSGDLVGHTCCGSIALLRPLLWRRTGDDWAPPVEIDSPVPGAIAHGINDAGWVVGAYVVNEKLRAFAWSVSSGPIDLGAPYGTAGSARDISNGFQVVGESWNDSGAKRSAILWDIR